MNIIRLLLCWVAWLVSMSLVAQQQFLVMEYNVENLFDCRHDSLKNDLEFMPGSPRGWTYSKFTKKVESIARVILSASGEQVPDLVGLCEVENEFCVRTLVRYSPLREAGYEYVMTDSPDERGIDVVLLYQPYTFKLLEKHIINIPTTSIGGRPTRDILHVSGQIVTGDTLDVFLVHFPSRSGGWRKTEKYRLMAAGRLKSASDSIMQLRTNPHIIIMGDFNDYPSNKSLSEVLGARKPGKHTEPHALYNMMDGKPRGTYKYRGEWGILDQMIVSGTLLGNGNIRTSYSKARILDFPFLMEEDDKYGGDTPFRTFNGMRYKGGYSDHLPVLLEMEIHQSD